MCCQIISEITVVLPVPGGPCSKHKSVAYKAERTALICEVLSVLEILLLSTSLQNGEPSSILVSSKICSALEESKMKSLSFGFTGLPFGLSEG